MRSKINGFPKIIEIEGTDGSGKNTQARLIRDAIAQLTGRNVVVLSFPQYESSTSSLVQSYLKGEFGENPNDINAYAASTFYAVDRIGSYLKDWKSLYEDDNTVIIMDRYVESNIIHQCSKLETEREKFQFIAWLKDLEYTRLGLPKPDEVLFLNMLPQASKRLRLERLAEIKNIESDNVGVTRLDIHEKSEDYLNAAYHNGMWCAKTLGWTIIPCVEIDEVEGNRIDGVVESVTKFTILSPEVIKNKILESIDLSKYRKYREED